eukprot:jgi/Astpho2/5907/Aster-02397
MQIFYKTDSTHTLDVGTETTVADVKCAVQAAQGLPVVSDELRVMFAGKQLEDADMLAECGVEDASTLHILMRLLGGAKKRKKKTYTKPKKQKHKHKKIKMRVLKFYKVDDSGKVQRLRKQCPSEQCGEGIFMATHFNRVYCGKCGLTYMMDEPVAKGKGKKGKA